MDDKITKFINRAKTYVGGKATGNMPPAQQMTYLMDCIERIQKLAFVSDSDRKHGLDTVWSLYSKVQNIVDGKHYTDDESWGNAKFKNGVGWSRDNNDEVNFSTHGDNFEDLIDSTLVPDGRTKVKQSEY